MKHLLQKVSIVFMCLTMALNVHAEKLTGTLGSAVKWTLDTEAWSLEVTGSGDMGILYASPWGNYADEIKSVTIAEGITEIGTYAFKGFYSITEIVIPASVTKIDHYAFQSCDNLKSVKFLNSGETTLGHYTFGECSKIEEITINGSLNASFSDVFHNYKGKAVHINDLSAWCKSVFKSSSSKPIGTLYMNGKPITDLVIPNDITNIGAFLFFGCNSIESVVLHDNVTRIGESTFGRTEITSLKIPKGVTEIASGAFAIIKSLSNIIVDEENTVYDSRENCNAIIETNTNTLVQGSSNTVIPNGVTKIGETAFCDIPLANINIPSSVTSIGNNAFSYTSIVSINIPNSVTEIDGYAFAFTENLTEVKLPNGVESIGDCCFMQSAICSIELPATLTSIGASAFLFCENLETVKSYIPADKLFEMSDIIDKYYDSSTLYVPYGAKEKYESTPGWSSFNTIVEMTLEETDIDMIRGDISETYYDLNGNCVQNIDAPGIYLVRKNGTTNKVLIK